MEYTPKRRHSPAKIVAIFVLVVAFASTAWAEVLPSRNSSKTTQLSYTQAVALTAANQGVKGETAKLRLRLIKEKREAHRKRRLRLGRINAAPPATVSSSPTSSYSGQAEWDAIAACETGGVWSTNTGNGYWGGLQFAPGTWFAYGGGPFDGSGPFPYSRSQQIAVAERVLSSEGPSAWPVCFRYA
jgi:hypothetical protein